MKGMVICRECGKLYFTWKKLTLHLSGEHDYELKLEEDEAMKKCVECGKPFDPEYQGDPEDTSCQDCIDKRNADIK